jgi:hypothetical protein
MPWRPEGILQGIQYALEGSLMVVQNPQLRKERYLQIFGYLLVASIALFALSKVLISLPLQILRFIAFLISVPGRYDNSKVDGFLLSVGRRLISCSWNHFDTLILRLGYDPMHQHWRHDHSKSITGPTCANTFGAPLKRGALGS